MSVIATVRIGAEDFRLGAVLDADPEVRVRLERLVSVNGRPIPYLWVSNEDVRAIEAALSRADDVDSIEVVDRTNGDALVRADWGERPDGFLEAVTASGGVVLGGSGQGKYWRLELRFEDHPQLTEFYRRCTELGIDLELESVHNPGIPRDPEVAFGLTGEQRETLRVALDRGYYEVPRRTNLVELAESMGISDSAVSQRLRRATEKILRETLFDGSDDDR
ncbi:MAG: helix-turn-helix domain-containing protein [Halosimplex sp.]